MIYAITGTDKIAAGTAAKDVKIGFRAFSIMNNSSGTVYFRPKDTDGKPATTDSMALGAGEVFPLALTCDVLSVIATGEADVRILYLDGE